MATKSKTIKAMENHWRKEWSIVLTGSGIESRNAVAKALSGIEAKGLTIVNGAKPFAEIAPRRKKAVKPQGELAILKPAPVPAAGGE